MVFLSDIFYIHSDVLPAIVCKKQGEGEKNGENVEITDSAAVTG